MLKRHIYTSLLSRGKADFVVFHSPGKFLDGIFHSVNLRMGLVQEPAEKKMRIPVPIEQAEYALSGSENSSFPVLSVKQIC